MNYKGRFTIAKKPKASIILKIAFGFRCIDWLDWNTMVQPAVFFCRLDGTFNLIVTSASIIDIVCHGITLIWIQETNPTIQYF